MGLNPFYVCNSFCQLSALSSLLLTVSTFLLWKHPKNKYFWWLTWLCQTLNPRSLGRKLLLSVFSSMLPGTMVLVIGFFGILHSWLNAFAEMTRFADRMFYRVSIILTLPVRNPTIKLYNNYTRRFVWSVNKLADPPYKCLFNFTKVCMESKQACWPSIQISLQFYKGLCGV